MSDIRSLLSEFVWVAYQRQPEVIQDGIKSMLQLWHTELDDDDRASIEATVIEGLFPMPPIDWSEEDA